MPATRRQFTSLLGASLVGLAGCSSNPTPEGTIIVRNHGDILDVDVRIDVRPLFDYSGSYEPIQVTLPPGESRTYENYVDDPGRYRLVGFLNGEQAGSATIKILTNRARGEYVTATALPPNLRMRAVDA